MNKRDAQTLFVMEVYQLECYGMLHVPALLDGQHVTVGIGARSLQVRDSRSVRLMKWVYSILIIELRT